ncbi:MAG TPA: flagellar basal body rod protein FlgC [Novosphingobium sp.]|nr:flagellar basal body rod protein FlgC [Novosphingobium sp.]
MTMAQPLTLFGLAQRGMAAQLVRMNAAASNLANAGSVTGSADEAYRPIRPVFAEQLDRATGLSTVQVKAVLREEAQPVARHEPDHPLADANGNIWTSPVDENAEMVEMLEASRQYRNLVEALSTARDLMVETMRMK